MFKILRYLKRREWIFILISFGLIFGQVFLELEMPVYVKQITLMTQDSNPDIWGIVKKGLIMLSLALGSLALSVVVGYIFSRLSSRFSARLRTKTFDKTTEFSLQEINAFSTPSLITRSTNDINQVQMFISMGAQLLIKAPILAVWSVLKISKTEWQWSVATAAAIFLIAIVLMLIVFLAVPRFKRIQKNTDELNKYSRENLTGLRVIKAYNAESFQKRKINLINDNLMNDGLFTGRIMSLIGPTMTLVMTGINLVIYWIGAGLIHGIDINILNPVESIIARGELYGNMVVFSTYAIQAISAFMMLIMIFIILPRAQVSAGRILEVLDTKTKIKDGSEPLVDHIEMLEFNNVSFKYPDASDLVLDNISFKATAGQTVAIIGATGAGKTTLINLIPRFYDVTEGEIKINGLDIKKYVQKDLRRRVGYISQQAFLFSGTIKSNVNYGLEDETKKEDIQNALTIAQASDFVNSLDERETAHVSQAGKNFSGGQKQRLSIARAIQKEAEILIFDDSFSALDYRTDRNLRDAIKKNLNNQITLIVAQRIGTIQNADLILVLDQGKIVGAGKHNELLRENKVYREIALSQLSEEELQ